MLLLLLYPRGPVERRAPTGIGPALRESGGSRPVAALEARPAATGGARRNSGTSIRNTPAATRRNV